MLVKLEVLPSPASNDAPDAWDRDGESTRKFGRTCLPRGVQPADLKHIRLDQSRPSVTRARMSLAPLASRVRHVVSVRAKEQMTRIYARRIVAAMKNMQAVRDRAKGEFVRDPMRASSPVAARTEVAVTVRQARSCPFPAVICSTPSDVTPEALLESESSRALDDPRSLPAHVVHSAITTRQTRTIATADLAPHYTTVYR
jgi:hypothetical protein